MLYSQNGWSVDPSRIASYTIPGTQERIALRKGDTSVVLLDFAGFVHAEVEDLEQPTLDEWGFAIRLIAGSDQITNHASGTAEDLNARKHPLGVAGTWTAAQKRKLHARVALYDGVVRLGEDYHERVDGMHAEIVGGAAAVAAVAQKIRTGTLGHGAKSYLVGRKPFAQEDPVTPQEFERIRGIVREEVAAVAAQVWNYEAAKADADGDKWPAFTLLQRVKVLVNRLAK